MNAPRCTHVFLSIRCNREHGHADAHAIGTPREVNKFFPRQPNSGNDLRCPQGCTRDHA